MPFMEQLLYGEDGREPGKGRGVLAQSPGLSPDVVAEIAGLCDRWGEPPILGLAHPALMSFRLESGMGSIRGRLITVIHISRGMTPLFHAVVLPERAYANFKRNPFALKEAVAFVPVWQPGMKLDRVEIDCDPTRPLVDPAAGEEDLGLVDEAVLKYLVDGKVVLPLEQPSAKSDRCLALIIACLPEKDRKEMRFTSFASSDGNNSSLLVEEASGAAFGGWRRLMMTWLASDYADATEDYIKAIRELLQKGDLSGIAQLSERLSARGTAPAGNTNAPFGTKGSPAVSPPRGEQSQASGDIVLDSLVPSPASAPARIERGAAKSDPPIVRRKVTPPAARPLVPPPERPAPSRPMKRTRVQSPPAQSTRTSRTGKRLAQGLVLMAMLGLVGWMGWMWREGRSLTDSMQWAGLENVIREAQPPERAPTLLEVVDVGGVYHRQLKLFSGKGMGLNPSLDKGRSKALGHLRKDAADPLAQQIDLFVKLANDGIQQGTRPDRETQRMRSLAGQGVVLGQELARLELAWHSVAVAVFWEDLAGLPDKAVAARHDSLARQDKNFKDDAHAGLGMQATAEALAEARTQVEGMAALLSLFAAKTYTKSWEDSLAAAAAKVSPSASRMTRAYRNSAYTMVRLKKAERSAASRGLPFVAQVGPDAWPAAEIRSILPSLRSHANMFSRGHVPDLVDGTLALYAVLKLPSDAVKAAAASSQYMSDLRKNAAIRFHPAAYADFLERIRFEAAVLTPGPVSGYSHAEGRTVFVEAFRDSLAGTTSPAGWEALSTHDEHYFFARWAGHLAAATRQDVGHRRIAFAEDWDQCVQLAKQFQEATRQGVDWSKEWRQLAKQVRATQAGHKDALAGDPDLARQRLALEELERTLMAPLPLTVQSMTFRLDQARLDQSAMVRAGISLSPDGETKLSRKFKIGPAAPDGSGWVGIVELGWPIQISAAQNIRVKLLDESGKTILLTVDCPALNQGLGISGILRPRQAEGGSASLRIGEEYWTSPVIPDLSPVF